MIFTCRMQLKYNTMKCVKVLRKWHVSLKGIKIESLYKFKHQAPQSKVISKSPATMDANLLLYLQRSGKDRCALL